jgi:hypothetical protein
MRVNCERVGLDMCNVRTKLGIFAVISYWPRLSAASAHGLVSASGKCASG